jgi:EAL domain-containing protein (putative c-di-GMP-specific phosphodiesterase class I)
VEEEPQRALLEAKGCGYMQGWLLGRGQEAAAFHANHLIGGHSLAIAA